MDREEFTAFVEHALEDIVRLAEARLGQSLPRPPRFQWLDQPGPVSGRVAEEIVRRIYSGPDAIRPCVDIGVAALDHTGRPIVAASVAGYPPSPLGKNWTGRAGPFVYFVGAPLLNGMCLDAIPAGQAFAYDIVNP
jgi:hypothetical protein